MPYLMIKVLTMLTNDTISFEQLGPGYPFYLELWSLS